MSITIHVNGNKHELSSSKESDKLLWVLREDLGYTGTKFGCGIAQCGSCTVHVNGQPIRACVTNLAAVADQEITTIESIDDPILKDLQSAWISFQVPQCGYCQSGQLMQAAALLRSNPNPSVEDIKAGMSPILCRCGTYMRVIKAIRWVAENREV